MPLDATLWILTSWPGYATEVRMNGRLLKAANGSPFEFATGEPLEANTRYDVQVSVSMSGRSRTVSFGFTTGGARADTRALPAPERVSLTRQMSRDLSALCRKAAEGLGCFDTGPPSHFTFEVDVAEPPLLWLLEPIPRSPGETPDTRLWPGVCGKPDYLNGARCFNLIAANETGERHTSGPFCFDSATGAPPAAATDTSDAGLSDAGDESPQASRSAAGGCSVEGRMANAASLPHGSLLCAVAALLAFRRKRRATRPIPR